MAGPRPIITGVTIVSDEIGIMLLERTKLRSYNCKYFLDDVLKKHVAHCHIGHIHYKDDSGDFQDVDYSFEDKGTYWQMTKASYRLYIAKDFGASQLIRFDNKYEGANHSIYYEPHSLQWVNQNDPDDRIMIRAAQAVTGVLSGHTITYTKAFGNDVDFVIELRRSGFKKYIRFNTKPALSPPSADHFPVLIVKYQADGLKLKANDNSMIWGDDSYYDSEEGFSIREYNPQYRSYIRRAYIEDAEGNRQKLKLFYEKRNNVLWQAKVLPKAFLNNAVYPVIADTTTSAYTGAGDGRVVLWWAGGGWAATRGAAAGSGAFATEAFSTCAESFFHDVNLNCQFTRGFFPTVINIPASATVSASTFYIYFYGLGANSDNDGEDTVCLTGATSQADPTTLGVNDYDNFGGTLWSDTKPDITTIVYDAYTSFPLNAAGIAAVQAALGGNYWLAGTLEGHDYSGNAIVGAPGNNFVRTNWSETVGTDHDPYLSVTYTMAYSEIINDGIGTVDSQTSTKSFLRTIADGIGSLDSLGKGESKIFADALGILDARTQARACLVADSLGITDGMSRLQDQFRTIADDLGLTDSMTPGQLVIFAESIGISDSMTKVQAQIRAVADSLGITDDLSRIAAYVFTPADDIGIADSMVRAAAAVRTLSDSMGITDDRTVIHNIGGLIKAAWAFMIIRQTQN